MYVYLIVMLFIKYYNWVYLQLDYLNVLTVILFKKIVALIIQILKFLRKKKL